MEIIWARTNKVFKITQNNQPRIRKVTFNIENLEAEIRSLKMLQKFCFNTPRIYYTQPDENEMVIRYIDNQYCEDNTDHDLLIRNEVDRLHSIKNDKFGLDTVTYSCKHRLENYYCDDWGEYFKNARWLPVMETFKYTLPEIYELSQKVSVVIPDIFKNKNIVPSLLHGDLNFRNILINQEEVFFIDPSCFYGDPDFDHAYYDIWKSVEHFETNFLLYYTYILLTSVDIYDNPGRQFKAKKYMEQILVQLEKYDSCIILYGSLNPVHLNHIDNIKKAETFLKANGGNNKVLLLFCLETDKSLAKICKNKCITMEHRTNMLSIALKESNVDNFYIDSTYFLGDKLIDFYKKLLPDTQFYVFCGLDSVIQNLEYFKDQKFLVMVRNNYEHLRKKYRIPNIKIICEKENMTISSTDIRNNWSDDDIISKYLHKDVHKYIRENNLEPKKYIPPPPKKIDRNE